MGARQMIHGFSEMNWSKEKYPAHHRIVALHHHVLPVVAQETIKTYEVSFSLTLDSGKLIYYCLENEVGLIAHGHHIENNLNKNPKGGLRCIK